MNARRKLAAPFQGKPDSVQQSAAHQDKVEVVDGFVNFRNFTFPPLENIRQLKFNKYCGPTPESNWVIPGVLLVGAYPASEDDDDTFDLITSILKHSITKFVCLQSEYQAGVNREVWQAGGALRPYFEDVEAIVSHKDTIPELVGHNIVDIDKLSFDHCPIIDCGVTDDSKVLALAQKLTKDISEGEVIYLHCWGGHGRTGTVVCIMLYLLYGCNPKQAFDYCQAVHDLRTCPVEVGSPQTQTQRQQVVRVINLLMREYEIRKAKHEEDAAVRRLHAQRLAQVEAEEEVARKARESTPSENVSAPITATVNIASAPPLKPNVVVRDTTQEHIVSMEKNNHSIAGAGGSLAYNSKLGRKVHNLHQQSTPNHNSGPPAVKAVSTLPALSNDKLASVSAPTSPSPATGARFEYPLTAENLQADAVHTANGTSPLRCNSEKKAVPNSPGMSESSASGLLQSLQAHPPRNPAPHNSRAEGLSKLHSRNTSSANSVDIHPNEIYVPRSSDEGESNDEEENGYLMVSGSTGKAPPLYSKGRLQDRVGANVTAVNTAYTDGTSSPMEVSPSVCSPTGFSLGYISSASTSFSSSRMSALGQESPMSGHVEFTSSCAVVTEGMELVIDGSPTTSGVHGQEGYTHDAAIGSRHHPSMNGFFLQQPLLDVEGTATDDAVRPASGTADDPDSRAQSTDSTTPRTARRLSGKLISNAFKAGMKILTGGSTPKRKGDNGANSPSNSASTESLNSSTAAATPATSTKPPSLLIQSFKTATTESSSSFPLSPTSYSNAPTPTNQPATTRLESGNEDSLDKTTPLLSTVDPTPPKGQMPTVRPPQHTGIPK